MNYRVPVIAAAVLVCLPCASAANADLKLSQLVVELQSGSAARDVELWNDSSDRAFVAVEPREIVSPGTASEADRRDPDPQKLGLLVSPSRVVLEPGQRRLLRVASLSVLGDQERVYRVTVKPVAGVLKSSVASGIKVMVGYDILVLVRPTRPTVAVTSTRRGTKLALRNDGNSSVELVDGQQCDVEHKACSPLRGKRLYAGATWLVDVLPAKSAEFTVKTANSEARKVF